MASSLSSKQIAFLAHGPKYIPVCQSHFSHLPIHRVIELEYEKIIAGFIKGFNNNRMSATDERAIQFFAAIKDLLCQLLSKPLSSRLLARAQHDYRMVKSIQRLSKQQNIVIQKTDKSKVFHLGSTQSYHQKASEYMQTTNAYKELQSGINPCMIHFRQVSILLNSLLKKKAINLHFCKGWMYPNVDKIELAHSYHIPKPHKVNFSQNRRQVQ